MVSQLKSVPFLKKCFAGVGDIKMMGKGEWVLVLWVKERFDPSKN